MKKPNKNFHSRECPLCKSRRTIEFKEFSRLHRVTSDCRHWPAGGRLAFCKCCGLTFKPLTPVLEKEIRVIYKHYAIYHQSMGAEQRIRQPRSGRLIPRSEALITRILRSKTWPKEGSCLDVGCGNGAFLKVLSSRKPRWRLYGTENDSRHKAELGRIPGFYELFTDLKSIRNHHSFDLISMIHLLEHIPDPVLFLGHHARQLAPTGRIFVECPDLTSNPFDLLIADHLLHLTPASLSRAAAGASLSCRVPSKPWIPKEISAVLARDPNPQQPRIAPDPSVPKKHLNWLLQVADQARQLSGVKPIGIFGTSIAGTWVAGIKDLRWSFFVDEDPSRVGRRYLNKPVLTPDQIKEGQTVLIPLAPSVSGEVQRRLKTALPKVNWVCLRRAD